MLLGAQKGRKPHGQQASPDPADDVPVWPDRPHDGDHHRLQPRQRARGRPQRLRDPDRDPVGQHRRRRPEDPLQVRQGQRADLAGLQPEVRAGTPRSARRQHARLLG